MIRRHKWLALFTVAYMVGFNALALSRGNSEFLFYGVVMLVIIAGVVVMHLRVRFSSGVLWLLAVWGLAHMAGGTVRVGDGVLYSYWFVQDRLKYDNVVHCYGFFCATLAAFEAARGMVREDARFGIGMFILFWCAGMGLGAVNEVVEFAAVLALPETNVGGYINTGWDMVANMVGAGAACVWLWVRSGGGGRAPRRAVGA